MKKGTRITLSILLPLILNIAFIFYMVFKDSECERKAFRLDTESQNIYFYLGWIILQIIVLGLIFIKSRHRKQIIALPIVSLLFIVLFTSWTLDLNVKDNYRKFDKETWINGNIYSRINYVEDIVSNNKLENKCYNEIIEMLGEPMASDEKKIEYELGFGVMIIGLQDNCFDQVEIKCK